MLTIVQNIDEYDDTNLAMIRDFAAFKWKKRTFDSGGYLLAEIEDFKRAKRLFEAQTENTVTKMNENKRLEIQYLADKSKCTINNI